MPVPADLSEQAKLFVPHWLPRKAEQEHFAASTKTQFSAPVRANISGAKIPGGNSTVVEFCHQRGFEVWVGLESPAQVSVPV